MCDGPQHLDNFNLRFDLSDTLPYLKHYVQLKGLTLREFAVLNAAGYAAGQSSPACSGLYCQRGDGDGTNALSNVFFKRLLDETWVEDPETKMYNNRMYLSMLETDVMLKKDNEFKAIAEEYANDESKFFMD